jgi:hypothetical protein
MGRVNAFRTCGSSMIVYDGSMSVKRQCFEKIEALAVNRGLFLDSDDSADVLVKTFFPKLKLLIILVDDKPDLVRPGTPIFDAIYLYEERKRSRGRREFAMASTGPFTPVPSRNVEYQSYIEGKFDGGFE